MSASAIDASVASGDLFDVAVTSAEVAAAVVKVCVVGRVDVTDVVIRILLKVS
jgi:hypothetical protein